MKRVLSIVMVMVLILGTGSVFANESDEIPGMDQIIIVDEDGERTLEEDIKITEQAENTFSDLGSHWGRVNIMRLYNMGGISGYPDGTVRPNGTVTKAEFLALASKTIYPEKIGKAKSGEHWAKPFFDTAWANGTVSPAFLEEDTWNDNITRYEMAEIIVRFLEKVIEEESENVLGVEGIMEDYEDVSTNGRSYYVQQAFVKGIITGRNANGLFAGEDNGTRAEAATLIIRLIDSSARKEVVLDTTEQVVEEEEDTEGEYANEDWKDEWAAQWNDTIKKSDSDKEIIKEENDSEEDFVLTDTFIKQFNEKSLKEVNEVRAENGVEPLELSNLVIEVAQFKSEDMLSLYNDGEPFDVYFSHDSKNYGDVSYLMEKFRLQSIGENIGFAPYKTKKKMHNGEFERFVVEEMFEKSPGHFKNMINPKWTEVGFGITSYYDSEKRARSFLVTQTFTTGEHDSGEDFVLTDTFIKQFNEKSLKEVNEVRAANNAEPLELSNLVIEVAQFKSEDMLSLYNDGEPFDVYFSHDSKNYGDVSYLMERFGLQSIGENIGFAPYKPKKKMHNGEFERFVVEEMFEKSPGHFKNMINPTWTKVGFGITTYYDSEKRIRRFLVTQTFSR